MKIELKTTNQTNNIPTAEWASDSKIRLSFSNKTNNTPTPEWASNSKKRLLSHKTNNTLKPEWASDSKIHLSFSNKTNNTPMPEWIDDTLLDETHRVTGHRNRIHKTDHQNKLIRRPNDSGNTNDLLIKNKKICKQ